jgi:hypothetical protein
MAGSSLDLVCNKSNMRSSQHNQACRTLYFSYLLVSSTSFSSSSPISLLLVHNSTIITEHTVKSSLSISPCHDYELTPSTAYIEYDILRVQHTPSTASTQDCLFSFHSHDYELTSNCSLASSAPPYTIDHHQLARHESLKIKSPCHVPIFASQLTEE